MTTKQPSTAQPLSKQRILEAAIAFADEYGVDALTMRKVADKLGCGVMSLYNHVSNKDEMLVGMVDIVVGEIDLPSVECNWKDTMRASAKSAHDILMSHPWTAAEWSRRMPGSERTRYMDAILKVLTEAKLCPQIVYSGYHAITMHIIGFTLQEIGYKQILAADFDQLAGEFLDDMSGAYPYMADHVRAHLNDDCDSDEFGFVLDLILDGLERASNTCSN